MDVSAQSIPTDPVGFERWCDDAGIRTVVAGSADTHAQWIGKRMPVSDFLRLLLGEGVAFSDVFFTLTRCGTDVVEPPNPNQHGYFPSKEVGYPDVFFRADLTSARVLSWHEGTVAVNGTFVQPDGSPTPIAPRNILAEQVSRAGAHDLDVQVGFEFEFYLFEGVLADLEANDYRLRPLATRPYTYSVFRSSIDDELLLGWRAALEAAGVHIESLAPETGPGQYELNTRYVEAMRAGDDAFLYKHSLKELATARGMMASFMAKPGRELPGSSCHLHQSLWSHATGEPILPGGAPGELSQTGRHYLGGLIDTMTELTALFWPTVNSYKRPTPYSWGATTATWGLDNRSVAVRMVGSEPGQQRLEHRMGGADVNPYILIAACIAGGLYGIEHEIEPPDPVLHDAYADTSLPRLPRTLSDALDRLESSAVARKCFGDDFVDHYLAMKRWEVSEYHDEVSDWEIRHYIETA